MPNVDINLETKDTHLVILFDENGFLLQPELWNEEVSQYIADYNGVQMLSPIHTRLIRFVRDYYFSIGGFVSPRQICSKLDVDKVEMKNFFGSCINVWKIAGLPNPGEEILTYMN